MTARRRSTALMSHSTIVVQCAAISSERFMCSPIDLRMRDRGSPWPDATGAGSGAARAGPGAGAAGRGGGAGRGAGGRRQRRGGGLGGRGGAAPRPAVALEEGEDVLLAHAAAAAGARDL